MNLDNGALAGPHSTKGLVHPRYKFGRLHANIHRDGATPARRIKDFAVGHDGSNVVESDKVALLRDGAGPC